MNQKCHQDQNETFGESYTHAQKYFENREQRGNICNQRCKNVLNDNKVVQCQVVNGNVYFCSWLEKCQTQFDDEQK